MNGKITLTITLPATLTRDAFLRAAARGLTSTNDAGEAVLVAVEAAAGLCRPELGARDSAVILAALDANGGNVSATARGLGIARSTVRAHRARVAPALPTCPACETRPGALDGYCSECSEELTAEIDARRGGDEWMPR